MNNKVTDYINNGSPEQIEILNTLRDLIHSNFDGVSEEIKWGIPVFIKTKIFTYLRLTKKHIALGFYNIDKIKDPKGILEGDGATMRHLKLKSLDDIDSAQIIEWFNQSFE